MGPTSVGGNEISFLSTLGDGLIYFEFVSTVRKGSVYQRVLSILFCYMLFEIIEMFPSFQFDEKPRNKVQA